MLLEEIYSKLGSEYRDVVKFYKYGSIKKLNKVLYKVEEDLKEARSLAEQFYKLHERHSQEYLESKMKYGVEGANNNYLSLSQEKLRTSEDLQEISKHIEDYKNNIEDEINKIEKEKKLKKKKRKLKQKEQFIFDLELEKQRLAQEHELEKLDKLLQIEEMKLIREREQRQAEQEQIDSLKDTLKQS